uniref:Uncharacterized protein n=1 Tax=Siphoviridae sp. ctzm5103 TaxID=2825750 RepID=A0A8S5TT75_9CAUD|nr:MAG TPA: hypothetical protein [Siphoviridae sp. ctzm5103]
MALIHVFDGINKHTSYTFSGKIKDHINNVDWENSVILKGGYRIDENYEVQPDDVIFIRKTPTSDPVSWAIGLGALAIIGAGVSVGISMYNTKVADEKMKEAQKKNKALSENVDKLPFIKGARNQAATGRSFPYAIGESLMTPYRLCPPHYTIAGTTGDEQYYNVVLEVAYNNILIKKIKMGETIIKDFSGVSAPQNGQYAFDAGVYYDARNLIEIRQTGAFTDPEFNKKVVLTELNEEIPHEHASGDPTENERIEKEWKAGVVQELASHAQAVELIALFDGLRKYDKDWEEQTITLKPQWTNAANPNESDWKDFTNGFNQNGTYNNTFTYNTKNQMRYVARQEFTAAQAFNKNMKVRVIRTTPKADSSAKDSVYLLAVQTYCYDAKKSSSSQLVAADVLEPTERDKCCRIGVRVAANVNTTGLLDAISVIESGCARTWNGTAWSSAKTPTRNLAAWVLELMTSPHHRPSKYDDAELDLASFGAWYTYCQQQGFNADSVITKNAKKKQTIETLCKNGNAALVYNSMTGKIEVAIDNGRDYSIALLNSENIISISTTKEFKRKTTGKKVTYINAAADYDADSVIFMRDGEAYDPATDTLTEAALEYITDYQHAFKYAWRQMAEEIAQPRIITVKAGLESAYYPIFSRVELQHKSLKIGIAHGVIKACIWYGGLLREIHLDGAVTFPTNGNCGVLINCVSDNGRGILALKVSGSGKTNILHVETNLRNSAALIPTAGNALSFGKLDINGEFTTVTSTCKITNAEESDNGYTLTLVDYNPALYQYGALPEYRSNLTSVPNGNAQTVESQREYVTTGESQADAAGAAQAVSDEITKGTRFTNIYKIRPVDMSLEDVIKKMDDDARNASASISMSADEILLQVENLDEQQRAFIAITKDQILAQVDDMAKELTGLINVQAGAVTALVEGGGAAGQMSLSLNLPVMIDAATRAKFVQASSEDEVSAVYAKLAGTEDIYAIKGNAGQSVIKNLWDKAIAGGLIASQIVLDADQINLAGKTIFTSQKTASLADTAQRNAEATAAADATTKANAAQSAAEATAEANRKALINAISQSTAAGQTVIDGGYLKTALIDVENILVKNIAVKDKGVIRSNNYNGVIDENGVINTYGTQGWAVDNAGNSDFVNINATGGNFTNVNVSGKIEATDSSFNGTLNCGSLKVLKATTYTNLKQFTTSDEVYELYIYLQDRGAGTTTKTVAALFSSYANPVMLYGNTLVNNVRLYTTSQTIPFVAIFYHIVFNGTIDIFDALGQDVRQIMLAQNWIIKYSIGEKLTFMLEDLPTSQPVDAGIVWRDGNTLKIS